jgi:hypothetical protein
MKNLRREIPIRTSLPCQGSKQARAGTKPHHKVHKAHKGFLCALCALCGLNLCFFCTDFTLMIPPLSKKAKLLGAKPLSRKMLKFRKTLPYSIFSDATSSLLFVFPMSKLKTTLRRRQTDSRLCHACESHY